MKSDLFDLLAEIFTGQWRDHAACAGSSMDIFFDEYKYPHAKKLFSGCPVEIECLDNALYYDDGGFRANLTPEERNSIVMHRRRHLQAFNYDVDPKNEKTPGV